jgi:hypothetical protein
VAGFALAPGQSDRILGVEIAACVSVAFGATGGRYRVLGAILLAFVSAAVDAWVLLVEITR